MDDKDRALWRINIALYGVFIALLAGATIAAKLHHVTTSAYLGASAIIPFITASIISAINDKRSRRRINELSEQLNQLAYTPVQEENFPWLDKPKLQQWTSEFSALGFTMLGDYTLNIDDPITPESFNRYLSNEKLKCFASISQSLHPQKGLQSMSCSVVTLFESGEQCITVIGKAPLVNAVLPIGIDTSYLPDASPDQLLQQHLVQRDKYAVENNLVIMADASFEAYQQQMKKYKERLMNWIYEQAPGARQLFERM